MLYAIIPLDDDRTADEDERLRLRVAAVDPTAYIHYAPNLYLVSYPGTSAELAEQVGFTKKADTPIGGVIFNIPYYYGYASPDMWEWLGTRNNE